MFHGPMATLYEYCSETMRTAGQARDHLSEVFDGANLSLDEVSWGLAQYCERKLMVEENGKYLGLAVPANPNW
jgi:hypothetical protein